MTDFNRVHYHRRRQVTSADRRKPSKISREEMTDHVARFLEEGGEITQCDHHIEPLSATKAS